MQQFIFEIEDFSVFNSQINTFTKQLEQVVAFDKIVVLKDKQQITVYCSGQME